MAGKKTVKRKPPVTSGKIYRILAYLIFNRNKATDQEKRDMIATLSALGFGKKTIALVLRTTPQAVSDQLPESEAPRKRAKKN